MSICNMFLWRNKKNISALLLKNDGKGVFFRVMAYNHQPIIVDPFPKADPEN